MLILAVEQSTVESSAVICEDTEVLASVKWEESRIRSQQFFPKINTLLSRAAKTLENIDFFAVGTGPGSFSALRMSISAVQAFALPQAKPVYAVSSAQALALQLSGTSGRQRVSIVGDARRGHLWIENCVFADSPVPVSTELIVAKPETIAEALKSAELVASPDFDRIPGLLGGIPESSQRLHGECVRPDARFVAESAFACRTSGIESPRVSPIYIHPAV